MRKLLCTIMLITGCLLLSACTTNAKDTEPGMEGYVVNEQGGRILVVSSVPKDYSATGGVSEFYNAIWFSNAPKNVQIGDKVQVWFDFVEESYPGQSSANKVSILPRDKPKNANLHEAEAIRKALEKVVGNGVPVIKAVSYDTELDVWTVTLGQVLPEKGDFTVKVNDK